MRLISRRLIVIFGVLVAVAMAVAACGGEDPTPVVVEVEVPGETVIVEVPGETTVVEVPGETTIVEVPGETVFVDRDRDTAVPDHIIEYEETLALAREEGLVSIVGHESALRRAIMKDEFEKRFPGISVEYLGINNSDAAARLPAEWDSGVFKWDVMSGRGLDFQFERAAAGDLQPIRSLIILPDLLEEHLWVAGLDESFVDEAKRFIFGFGAFSLSITWQRADLLPIATITRIEQLLDPAYKGQIAMVDPRTDFLSNYVISFIYHGLGEAGIRTLFEDQDPTIFGTSDQLIDAMVRTDDYTLAFGFPDHRLQEYQEAGLVKAFNIEPTQWNDALWMGRTNGAIAVPVNNPHPNATKIWVNWMLGREAQLLWSFESGEPSARLDIPVGEPLRWPDPARGDWTNFQAEEFQVSSRLLNPTRDLIGVILDEQGK